MSFLLSQMGLYFLLGYGSSIAIRPLSVSSLEYVDFTLSRIAGNFRESFANILVN